MIPTWLLTTWHVLSIASAVVVLMILCWQSLRPRTNQPEVGDTTQGGQPGDSPHHESN
jgi:hypothetical protein